MSKKSVLRAVGAPVATLTAAATFWFADRVSNWTGNNLLGILKPEGEVNGEDGGHAPDDHSGEFSPVISPGALRIAGAAAVLGIGFRAVYNRLKDADIGPAKSVLIAAGVLTLGAVVLEAAATPDAEGGPLVVLTPDGEGLPDASFNAPSEGLVDVAVDTFPPAVIGATAGVLVGTRNRPY